jgi:hypothetical protein
MEADPISQFFPDSEGEEDVLYAALGLGRDATLSDITVRLRSSPS